jgi:hypothetical protein
MVGFDSTWGEDLDSYLIDEKKDAIDSVVGLRHKIAHGEYVGVTISRVRDYYAIVAKVVDHVADLCVPSS